MAEISEILKSEELGDVTRAIERLFGKHNLPRKRPDQKTFKYLALGKTFQAREVLGILLDHTPTYPGFKEVLAAGFCGWVLLPGTVEVRNTLMIQEIIWHLDDAERKAGLLHEPLDLERDLIARYMYTGLDFLTDIYGAFGGYEAFTRINNVETMREHFTPVRKILNTSVKALTFLHYGADSYQDPEYDFQPSLNRAVSIFKELKKNDYSAFQENFVSRSLLHEHWSSTKETLALLYSASTIKAGRKSLLQIIMSLNSTHQEISKYLHAWLGRARYVSDHIFAKMADDELHAETGSILRSVSPLPFSPPEISSIELTILRAQFRKKLRKTT